MIQLQCESLEDQLAALRLELGEKLAEIDVVKAELTLVKAQRESLLKSLRYALFQNPFYSLNAAAQPKCHVQLC